jgi:hypothetical protein
MCVGDASRQHVHPDLCGRHRFAGFELPDGDQPNAERAVLRACIRKRDRNPNIGIHVEQMKIARQNAGNRVDLLIHHDLPVEGRATASIPALP